MTEPQAHGQATRLPAGAQVDVAVVVLTYNEQLNLAQALQSVRGWAREVFVFDSFSTDRTVDIAREHGAHVMQHRFENYARQRNAALDQLPITAEWVLFLDADEWLPDALKDEIEGLIARDPTENGFYLSFRFLWMGRWIRRGYYPTWVLRLLRRGKARCEDRSVNEHLVVEGATRRLANDFVHEDHRGVADWVEKHNRYTTLEARELFRLRSEQVGEIDARLFGSQAQRRRWLRHRVFNRLPPLVRPVLYWIYRYFICGGFLDGREAFTYHFLQALWYPMLIDIKYLEMRRRSSRGADSAGSPPRSAS